MHLQKQECFVLGRRVVFGLERSNIAQLLVVDIFVVPKRGLLELFCIGHQPKQCWILHVRRHLVCEFFDCQVLKVVAARNEAQLSRHHKCFSFLAFMNFNTARILQLLEYFLHEVVQKLANLVILIAVNLVKVRILENSSEQEAPGDPLDALLRVADLSSCDLSVDVVSDLQ